MSYKKDVMNGSNLMFGIIWAAISLFLGAFITKVIEIIETIMTYFISALSYIILFPSNFSNYFNLNIFLVNLVLSFGIAILLAPIIKQLFDWIIKVIRRSPL